MKNILIFLAIAVFLFQIYETRFNWDKIVKIDSHFDGYSYIIFDKKEKSAVLIDANVRPDTVMPVVNQMGAKLKYVLVTHHHHARNADDYQNIATVINAYSDYSALEFREKKITVIETPGHTRDSLCFLVDGMLFSGDTLFRGNVGRYDFNDSNLDDLMNSIINKLYTLPPETTVYSGHTAPATIGHEIQNNPLVKEYIELNQIK